MTLVYNRAKAYWFRTTVSF